MVSKADVETAENLLAVTTDKDSDKVHADEYGAYHGLKDQGYQHDTVNHSGEEWVRGDVHANGIEGFWSQIKRSIDGTHHHVSKQHLQKYADEYAFRFNRRRSEKPMFAHLVSQMNEQRGREGRRSGPCRRAWRGRQGHGVLLELTVIATGGRLIFFHVLCGSFRTAQSAKSKKDHVPNHSLLESAHNTFAVCGEEVQRDGWMMNGCCI